MNDLAAIDEINRLLDAEDDVTVNTSMRLPVNLRDAAALAADRLGAASSTTTMTASALRQMLETTVMDAALRVHYDKHPETRPTLAEVAQALARQNGSPLAARPEVIEAAARAVTARHPNADADDVLLWAEAQLEMSA